MSEAFSQSPPVYANSGATNSTPYPTNTSSMPMPVTAGMGMNTGPNTSHSYPHGYPQTQIPQDVYRESLQSAVLDKVRQRLDEAIQMGTAQIDSLRRTEQDLIDGDKKLQSLISDAQQQQVQAEVLIFPLSILSLNCFCFRIISQTSEQKRMKC